jgi:hypothetical protein
MPVLAEAELKKSLTYSRKRGSPLTSRPGPATFGTEVVVEKVLATRRLVNDLALTSAETSSFVKRLHSILNNFVINTTITTD